MTTVQVMLLAGGLVGLGCMLVVAHLLPVEPDLAEALDRLSPHHTPTVAAAGPTGSLQDRLGQWATRSLPPGLWVKTPTRELAILRVPVTRFYGEKLTFAALGLVIPPILSTFFTLLGLNLPVEIPAVAALGLASVMFFIPNYNVIDEAQKARIEFSRALGAYIDLVALERHNGAGVRQAMEAAAHVGDQGSWVFRRLSEELARSRWSGLPPWDALHTLATELALPELEDFANTMRLGGEEGASVYTTLRAKSAALRAAMLTDEIAGANAVGERMSIPGSLLGVIFMALLIAPSLLRMFNAT